MTEARCRELEAALAALRAENQSLSERAEEAVRESDARFRQLFDNANDAMYLWELADDGSPGRCIEVNEAAARMTGYSRRELLRMRPQDLDGPSSFENRPGVMAELVEHGHTTFEATHQSKDGRGIPVEISSHLFSLRFEIGDRPRVVVRVDARLVGATVANHEEHRVVVGVAALL